MPKAGGFGGHRGPKTGSSSTNCVGASGADFTPKCLVIASCHLSVRVSAGICLHACMVPCSGGVAADLCQAVFMRAYLVATTRRVHRCRASSLAACEQEIVDDWQHSAMMYF